MPSLSEGKDKSNWPDWDKIKDTPAGKWIIDYDDNPNSDFYGHYIVADPNGNVHVPQRPYRPRDIIEENNGFHQAEYRGNPVIFEEETEGREGWEVYHDTSDMLGYEAIVQRGESEGFTIILYSGGIGAQISRNDPTGEPNFTGIHEPAHGLYLIEYEDGTRRFVTPEEMTGIFPEVPYNDPAQARKVWLEENLWLYGITTAGKTYEELEAEYRNLLVTATFIQSNLIGYEPLASVDWETFQEELNHVSLEELIGLSQHLDLSDDADIFSLQSPEFIDSLVQLGLPPEVIGRYMWDLGMKANEADDQNNVVDWYRPNEFIREYQLDLARQYNNQWQQESENINQKISQFKGKIDEVKSLPDIYGKSPSSVVDAFQSILKHFNQVYNASVLNYEAIATYEIEYSKDEFKKQLQGNVAFDLAISVGAMLATGYLGTALKLADLALNIRDLAIGEPMTIVGVEGSMTDFINSIRAASMIQDANRLLYEFDETALFSNRNIYGPDIYRDVEVNPPIFSEWYDDPSEAYQARNQYWEGRVGREQDYIDEFLQPFDVKFSAPITFSELDVRVYRSGSVVVEEGMEVIRIGAAYYNDSELLVTAIHEEMHLRLQQRARRGVEESIQILSDRNLEEEYVEQVALEYYRQYVNQNGEFLYTPDYLRALLDNAD